MKWGKLARLGVLSGLPLAASCAPFGHREASGVSRVLLGQLLTYESQVDRKIREEERYYREVVEALVDSSRRRGETAEDRAVLRAAQDFYVVVLRSDRATAADVRDAMLGVVGAVGRARAEQAAAVEAAKEGVAASMEPLELHRRSLGQVRKDLEQLQTGKNDLETVKFWVDFGRDVKKRLETE